MAALWAFAAPQTRLIVRPVGPLEESRKVPGIAVFIRCADRMYISCKMKIDVFHGNNLCISAARRAPFDTK